MKEMDVKFFLFRINFYMKSSIETIIRIQKILIIIFIMMLLSYCSDNKNNTPTGAGDYLPVPADFQIVSVSASSIELSWDDQSDNETGFRVERSIDESNFSQITVIDLQKNITSYSDNVSLGHTYYYRIQSVKNTTKSEYSAVVNAYVDSQPSVQICSSASDVTPVWKWSSAGGLGIYRYRLDNGDLSSMTETTVTEYTSDILSEGSHRLYVQEKLCIDPEVWSGSGYNSITINKQSNIAGDVVVNDELESLNGILWYWRTDTDGDDAEGACSLSGPGVCLRIPSTADNGLYSNAEFYNAGSSVPYKFNFIQVYLKNETLDRGSRGWGFWNGSLNRTQSEIAWFTCVNGDGYTNNGFYAVTQAYGDAVPVMTQISDIDLTEWHEYCIDWQSDSVSFWIDGVLKARHITGVPQYEMRCDVWIDNAVYIESGGVWNHVYQNISGSTALIIDSISIYNLSETYPR